MADQFEWTKEMTQKMVDFWNSRTDNPPSIIEIVEELFPERDPNTNYFLIVQKQLAKHDLKSSKDRRIVLTEEQKEYVQNNVQTMNSREMARILFNNPTLSNLHGETRAVNVYSKTLNGRTTVPSQGADEVPEGDYFPPKTFKETLDRINKYVIYCADPNKITATQKKNIDTLMEYLHTYRFCAQMNNYETQTDRRIGEDAFIRATYDKPDLAQEEIDQYIEYSNQVVQGFNIQRRSNRLQNTLEEISGNDSDNMKISMGLVEAIGKASTEYHQCKQREQKLLDDLKQKRSVRMSKQLNENASILNLVQAWKAEDTRKEMLALAQKEQESVGKEVERLSSLPDFKCRILGLTKEGILNG